MNKFINSYKITYLLYLLVGFTIGIIFATLKPPTSISPTLESLPKIVENKEVVMLQSPSPKTVSLLVVGDMMLGRSVNTSMYKTDNFSWPFVNVLEKTKAVDIFFANFEGTIVPDCPRVDTGFKFCTDLRSIEGIKASGLDVASLANNHTLNYGKDGLISTTKELMLAGVVVSGLESDQPIVVRDGIRFAFISFNDVGPSSGLLQANPENIRSYIAEAKSNADIIIAGFHWGNEYVSSPSARQVEFAHLAVDEGADIVVGAHPHWVQSNELYKGKPIYYSLGNFIFDQDWSEETKNGLGIIFTFSGNKLVGTEKIPVYIENNGQPVWVTTQ